MGRIVSIAIKPEGIDPKPADHFARVPVETAELRAGKGIAGDRKGNGDDRHLNVMNREILDVLATEGCKTAPGEMGEQIVISGIDLIALPSGARLRFGDAAEIEIVKPRTGCSRLQQIQQKTPKEVRLRLGVMCRVVADGSIRVGDTVALVER